MKIKYTCFLIFLLINFKLLAQETPVFEHYELNINSKKIKYSSIIDHIEIIRLEETENSLISYVSMFLELPKGFAIPNKDHKKIFLFNNEGKYLSSVNREGAGPTYYTGFSSVWLKNNTIEFFNSGKRELFSFGLNGEYLNHKQVNVDKSIRLGEMTMLGDGYVVSTIESISLDGKVESAGYSLIFLDKDLNVTGQKLETKSPPPFPSAESPSLIREGNEILFKKTLNDSLYYISGNQVVPYLHLDFKNDWAWINKGKKLSLGEAFSMIKQGSKVYEIIPVVSSKTVAIEYVINKELKGFGLLNRNTEEFFTLKGNSGKLWFKPLQWKGDLLIASMPSYQLESFLKPLGQEQWTVKGDFGLEEILSAENPVLLKIKFKDKIGR